MKSGFGDCRNMPLLCVVPDEQVMVPKPDKKYLQELTPQRLPGLEITVPKRFTVIKEKVKKIYYKRRQNKKTGAVIYLLEENPNFFLSLFPQVKKHGINNNYEFIKRTMEAHFERLNNVTDMFFLIMKTTLTAGMGDQQGLRITPFAADFGKGFITYKLDQQANYFDCNIFKEKGEFIKVYIKDEKTTLDLNKVMTIISTLKKT